MIDVIAYVKDMNSKRVAVVTSKTISKFNDFMEFIELLEAHCVVLSFNTILPDAPLEPLLRIMESHEAPDLIVSVGGGSVTDSSKALSISWINRNLKQIIKYGVDASTQKIPVISIPTTAGTGAEQSYGAILYDGVNERKIGIRNRVLKPEMVLIIPSLYLEASVKFRAEVAFDAMSHAIETYISKSSDPISRYQSVVGLLTIMNNIDKALKGDLAKMEQVAIASVFMGINLANSTTCLPHRIQYSLSAVFRASHAKGLLMIYGGWLPKISKTNEFKNLARDMNMSSTKLISILSDYKMKYHVNYKLGDFISALSDLSLIAKNVKGNLHDDPCYEGMNTVDEILQGAL